MFALDFPRTSMRFIPSQDPLLRDLLQAATRGVDARDLDVDCAELQEQLRREWRLDKFTPEPR
jgi:hypothetical protein